MSFAAVAVFSAGLVSGTASTILSKLLYSLKADGLDGVEKSFEKPLFQTLMMFLAMTLALPLHFALARWNGRTGVEGLSKKLMALLVVPACTDLGACALANVGLMYINVSVFQLMKCSVIIFVSILKRTVLRHRLEGYQWLGVLINMIAVTMVAASSFVGGDTDASTDDMNDRNSKQLLGVLLVVASCVIQSVQYVYEEKLMADMSAPPLIVIGMEGFWGTTLCCALVLPIASSMSGSDVGGVYENTQDTLHMIFNDATIAWLLAAYVFVITMYNVSAIYVTFLLDSVWHAILDNFRPISVWVTDLALYAITAHAFGEAWTKMSWLQLGGLILLLLGTAVYNASLKLPLCFAYEKDEDVVIDYDAYEGYVDLEAEKTTSDTIDLKKKIYASPMLARSPLVYRGVMKGGFKPEEGWDATLTPVMPNASSATVYDQAVFAVDGAVEGALGKQLRSASREYKSLGGRSEQE